MRPGFSPALVNGSFDDPGLFVDFVFERRALLFDLGDLAALPPRKLLRVSDVFVTHTHMDHFIGFDQLLRICLGRDTGVRLYGPPGFIEQVAHKLGGYTWNLVDRYPADFTIEAREFQADETLEGARFRCRSRFAREPLGRREAGDGILLDERGFRVRATSLDHQTTSLAFALEEKVHINVWKNRLDEMGLRTGPWPKALKAAEVEANEIRKKEQAEKSFDGLTYFVYRSLLDANIENAESVSRKIRESFAALPNWRRSESVMRDLRQKVTFAIVAEEDDIDKVSTIVDALFSLLARADRI